MEDWAQTTNAGAMRVMEVRQRMQERDREFLEVQRQYYAGKCSDVKLMEMTTQPFWQSMRLSKKRLDAKGIELDLDMQPIPHSKARDGLIIVVPQSNFICGACERDVSLRRSYYRNGKKLFSKKQREINHMSYLQSKVEDGMAACPNCGGYGTITSYIDGCDYCQSRFTVNDFEAKVSGYATVENTEVKITKTIGMMSLILAAISAILVVIGAIGFGVIVAMLAIGQNQTEALLGGIIAIMMPMDLVPFLLKASCVLALFFISLACTCAKAYKNPIQNEAKVKQVIRHFSAQDFFQNLEYKLRNIHMADNEEAVRAFAKCSLVHAMAGYKDVIDCELISINFEGARNQGIDYEIDAMVQMKLTQEKRGKIFVRYEKIAMSFVGRKKVVDRSMTALREYKCPNCGDSINILEGCTCKSCGSEFDYANYGWVITKYQPFIKTMSKYQLIRFAMVASYILVIALYLVMEYNNPDKDSWMTIGAEYNQMMVEWRQMKDDIPVPTDIWDDAVRTDFEDETDQWSYKYDMPDIQNRMKEYQKLLEEQEGFHTEQEDDVHIYMKKDIVLAGQSGYIQYELIFDEETCIIRGSVHEYEDGEK